MALPSLAVPEYEMIIPSTSETVLYRPFLVKEEKILYIAMESNDEKETTRAIMNLLKSCIITDFNINELTTYDLEYMFLNIRAKSVNDIIKIGLKHSFSSTECTGITNVEIPLEDVKILYNEKHNNTIVLDKKTKLGIELRDPCANDLSKFSSEDNDFNNMLEMIAICVKTVFDETEVYTNFSIDELKNNILGNLSHAQLEEIMEFFNTLPKLSYTLEFTCKKCNETEEATIEGLNNFFT